MTTPTPVSWRIGLFAVVAALAAAAYLGADTVPPFLRSLLGVAAFIGLAAACSANVRAINPRVVLAGFALQMVFALLITQVAVVQQGFQRAGEVVSKVVGYSQEAGGLLFGPLASNDAMKSKFGPSAGIPFGIILTCTVIFVACVFSALYHLRVLQAVVWVFAKLMILLMGKRGVSGAESLSAAANVFMGQTEAPLIVKPYLKAMTRSELLAIMVGGMATIAGGVMAIYIQMGADAAAILATSVMAAPCGLYVAKILMPETDTPVTRGTVSVSGEKPHANVIDAAAAGASDGMMLALNIIAMLIAFLALIKLANAGLGLFDDRLTLELIFSKLFAPVSALMGVDAADIPKAGELLGIKLIGNEFLAFDKMTAAYKPGMEAGMTPRSYSLATYALTGFANVGSIGIQLGGIGAMAPERRKDLARLGPRALLGGFLATLINASVAGLLFGRN
jgi:CNT family concentrative nucleoside transporter